MGCVECAAMRTLVCSVLVFAAAVGCNDSTDGALAGAPGGKSDHTSALETRTQCWSGNSVEDHRSFGLYMYGSGADNYVYVEGTDIDIAEDDEHPDGGSSFEFV